jgi:hypothetical protein
MFQATAPAAVPGCRHAGTLARVIKAAHSRLARCHWFKLCLRHGWLGSARRSEPGELKTYNEARRLNRVLASRKKRRLGRPYGAAAIRLGLARAGPAPP